MEPTDLQQLFFKHIKSKISGNISMADDIAGLLGISNDSAYRRIRGEKPLSLEEIRKLCTHYRISFDQIINIDSNSTVFFGNYLDADNFDFDKYLDDLLMNFKLISNAHEKMIWYESKDVPLFYYFQYDELCAFKIFFWMKTMLSYHPYSRMSFEDNDLSKVMQKKALEILSTYNTIPSAEIWSLDSINATLRQIEYYKYTGVFRKKETVELLFDQLDDMVEHIKEQAECGEKFLKNQKPQGSEGNYKLYYNEMFLGHNTIFVETDGVQTTFINHGILNYMITRDTHFCKYTKNTLNNIVKKSLLISDIGEKGECGQK